MNTIGKNIKQLKDANGYSWNDLVEKTGLSFRTLTRMAVDSESVKSDYVYMFCEIFNVTPNILFGYEQKKFTTNHDNFVNMNSSSLAKTLAKYINGDCDVCPALNMCKEAATHGVFVDNCEGYLKHWLERKVRRRLNNNGK